MVVRRRSVVVGVVCTLESAEEVRCWDYQAVGDGSLGASRDVGNLSGAVNGIVRETGTRVWVVFDSQVAARGGSFGWSP